MGKDILHIIRELENAEGEEQQRMISCLLEDDRTSVRKAAERLQNRLKKDTEEFERIVKMKETEKVLKERGYALVAGIDEAGRGPLAGPVVAAAVVLPEDFYVPGIDDSKKLSPGRREHLYQLILDSGADYGVGMMDNHVIDSVNILNATRMAADAAVNNLKNRPHCLLLDAIRLPGCRLYQESVIKGDQKCLSIAAASIIAKVVRDRLMDGMHTLYPQYNFKSNKGYGTREHMDAIRRYGPSPIHRETFIKRIWRKEL